MKAKEILDKKVDNKKVALSFAAIDKYVIDNIIDNVQTEVKGKDLIQYGDKNIYPNYLYGLFEKVSVLRSIINGIADYVAGDNVSIGIAQFQEKVNSKGETIEDIVREMALSYVLYGGIALNVLRNRMGSIAEFYVLDWRCVRSDKKNTKFYYSDEWADKQIGRAKAVVYPKFDKDNPQPSSILYVKADNFDTYPNPIWAGSVISAEILSKIETFNLSGLVGGLTAGYLINFNNGQPTDEQKVEIEEDINEKYEGYNACRVMMSFNPSYENRTTIEALPEDKSIDRYNTIYQTSIKNVYTAFRAHPSIFGLPIENTGFNDSDLREGFKLFNRTVVLPIQKRIKRVFEEIFGEKEIVAIEQFDIDFDNAEENIVK